ncbi:tubulin polyglutamylase TTLL5-like [Babylonia areolata]|uniref:tubulin polyglutamylase TTLL5-like n=1 Tax=Babylonia areolata TaxID=304850 RepID=UPI003FD29660
MASRGNDSDGGDSLTPSEQSDAEERSEHDSDYETDNGEEEEDNSRDKNLNIIWTGYSKRTPVILFNVGSVLQKRMNFKTVGERYHLAFKFGSTECKIIRNILVAHGFHEVHPNSPDFNLVWTNSHLKPFTLRTMTEFQKINHFPRSYELTRKDRLYKNIQRMQQIKGFKHFDFVPHSFVLPGEYQEFCSHFLKDRGPWIVKPVASSRGRGVFLVNHPDQVPLDENLIVCHYIHNPLVIDGFKFDVRLYVAVTSYDPLVIYLYEEGLTRFATVKYEKSNKHIRNQCMHLTNYSVNKKSHDYVKNDDPDVEDYGNKWSMGAMLRYLRSLGKDTAALMMRIEDVVIKTLLSVELSIATACKMFMPFRGNCFELYGFDILVDDSLKPWVLEVNLSPSLACDSPLDLKIKGNMLCDLFSLAGIVCHDPMMRSLQQQSRRNQEIQAKIAGRAKTAFTRPVSARTKGRPQSASSAGKTQGGLGSGQSGKAGGGGGGGGMAGLNSEEIKIMRRLKEEEQRRGGWIRIFPGPDTWDQHGGFLQFNTTHNVMVHQRLYPERHKMTKSAAAALPSSSKPRTGHLQVTGTGQSRQDSEKSIETYTLALVRARQYERKLGTRSRRKRKGSRRKDSRPRLVQGVADEEDDVENQSEEEEQGGGGGDGRGKPDDTAEDNNNKKTNNNNNNTKPSSSISTTTTTNDVPTNTKEMAEVQEVKVEAAHPMPPLPPPPEPKYDVVDLLVKGGTLNKVQARSAFAMYLVRVQQRLISEIGPMLQDDVDALNEQMDLVLRFLKRAAVNLQQTFRVVVPSRKLPLGDRRRILAKQLGDFVHIYNKETDQLKQQMRSERQTSHGSRGSRGDSDADHNKLDEHKFEKFVSTASEGDLEEVLTTYTKLNKSASIFLGSNSTSSSSATPPAKPPHNPMPAPSVQRAEMLQRRREMGGGDGDGKGVGGDDHYRVRSASSTDVRDAGSTTSSRPPSASSASYLNAVSIYSQKLSRPRSASTYKSPALFSVLDSDEAVKLATRPSSAYGAKPSPFSTSEPIVDTYNEQAIREALQRLAVRQQARQYSAINSSSSLRPDGTPNPAPTRPASATSSTSHRRGSLSRHNEDREAFSAHPGALQRPSSSSGVRHMTKEEYQASQARRNIQNGKPPIGKPPPAGGGGGKQAQTNVHMANANATFNSFIDENTPQWQTEIASAYSQVTGVPPNNYHTASVNSRQFQLALQQARRTSGGEGTTGESPTTTTTPQHKQQQQKRLLEQQSRAMMEASKAKHHAMVAQAHAAQRTTASSQSLGDNSSSQLSIVEVENPMAGVTNSAGFAPKPPVQPAPSRSKQAAGHRLTRVSPAEENSLNFNFYNSLQYDIHTGQLRRKAESK